MLTVWFLAAALVAGQDATPQQVPVHTGDSTVLVSGDPSAMSAFGPVPVAVSTPASPSASAYGIAPASNADQSQSAAIQSVRIC